MKPKHTPGPWRIRNTNQSKIETEDGRIVAMANIISDDLTDFANAERIVACVNACEGINDPTAVPEILEALKNLRDACIDAYKLGRVDALAFVASGNAISKAEGR